MGNNSRGRYYLVSPKGPLAGEVKVSGAKNAATKEIIASLLTSQPCFLDNLPRIIDTRLTLEMAKELGSEFKLSGNSLQIITPKIKAPKISESYSGRNRIPILMVGPLLHRFGEAIVPIVGGDAIGKRPINFHFDALRLMGAEVKRENDHYHLKTTGLKGAKIILPFPSVGATENVLFLSVLAKGTTVIKNAAIEPEIIDIVMVLQKMGAIIEMKANRTYVIQGVKKLSGFRHQILPDRLEAASFAAAAIASGGDILVVGARQRDMVTFLNKIRLVGGGIEVINSKGIRFYKDKKALSPISIGIDVYPGFSTDWQQPFAVLMTQIKGESIIHETIYEDRFGYVKQLNKMGANIKVSTQCLGTGKCRFKGKGFKHSAIILGKTQLEGAEITMPDIRAGFSYLLAAAIAKGESKVFGIEHVERGYELIDKKLRGLGVDVKLKEA